jgi:hypothetical protein
MKDKNKDMELEEAKDARELPDEELEGIIGGVDVLERVKPPSNERPPIEAPILNPFG